LLPFLLYGRVLTVRCPGFVKRSSLLFVFAGLYALLHLLSWAMVHNRLPVDEALHPLTAQAVVDLLQKARAGIPQRFS
jgi:hypothetical protein